VISAYVPCFNDAHMVRATVRGLLEQSVPVAEIVVIDDGSADDPATALDGCGVRVVRHSVNLGRGAARDRGMRETRHDLVVCCDATNVLDSTFLEAALPWFNEPGVAAVFGRIRQGPTGGVAHRWRGRHLLKSHTRDRLERRALLATWGAVVRRSAVAEVGGYDATLRHTEDGDLGARLLAAGFDVVCDPRLGVTANAPNTIRQVLERYWRWHAGADLNVSWLRYWRSIGYSIKVMARADVRDHDPLCVPISLVAPHYQFWRSWFGRRGKQ
jgi:glycosyltransferase involved in cell wall biosynthesis